jgi:pimeloyl-ACP methyl ester carboxylesterase
MDQRGSEDGSPLRCPVSADVDPFAGIFPAEALSRCRDHVARVADLAAYGTEDAAEDIDVARAALGYGRINLVGVSYGTRLALEYMARFPDRVRAAMLDGLAPRELRVPLHYVADAEAALRRLAALCRADAHCRRFGDPAARYRSVMSRLAATPATATVTTNPAAPERRVAVGPEDFAYAVRGVLYGDGALELPRLLAHADSTGDVTAFARLYAQRRIFISRTTSLGLHLTVLCGEDIAALTPRRIKAVAATTLAGSYLVDQYVAACGRWRVAPGRTDTLTPRLTRPLLLMSGALDPVTPPRWGDTVRARSANARHVIFPYGAHGTAGVGMAGCKARLVREFLRTARPNALDTRCVASATPPKFPPPDLSP